MRASNLLDNLLNSVDCCPWAASVGRHAQGGLLQAPSLLGARGHRGPLYTAEQRRRRDATPWTTVQGVLAPIQFLVFLVSLALVLRTLWTGSGATLATGSVVTKTVVLYAIMITGSIWEQRVFGRYLFAPSFFWEDVVSLLVLALHTAYLATILLGGMTLHQQLLLALAAYASYLINAAQYVLTLRAARRERFGQIDGFGGLRSC